MAASYRWPTISYIKYPLTRRGQLLCCALDSKEMLSP